MRGIPTGYMRAVALVPLVCGVYVMVFLLLDDLTGWSENVLWVIANVMGASVVALGWVLAWRRGVRWTLLLRRETGILCAGLVVFCGCSGLIESSTDWIDSLRVNLPLLVAGVFMVVTAWRWQGRSAALAWDEDEVQPHCVACGYNMTGLHQARCPECGRSYTLDELFEANVGMG